jgi:UDP-glucose 4-epimerase
VARAVRAAVHTTRPGIYNIAGNEALPLSELGRWTRRPQLPLPGAVLGVVSRGLTLLGGGGRAALDGVHLRYGFTLDTSQAHRELQFVPAYRIGLERAGDGLLRLETSPA